MKIAICDDNADDLSYIKELISEIKTQYDPELNDEYFSSGEDFISAAEKNPDFSFAILDIYMNDMSGIKTAQRICELMPNVKFAFITSSMEFAIEAYKLNAIHYIVKPINKEGITELFKRFFEHVNSESKKLFLKGKYKTYALKQNQIQKIQSSNKGVDIYLYNDSKPMHLYESFQNIEDQLDDECFLKISRGFIVNMSYILHINSKCCHFQDGTSALISRIEKEAILHKYNDYIFKATSHN